MAKVTRETIFRRKDRLTSEKNIFAIDQGTASFFVGDNHESRTASPESRPAGRHACVRACVSGNCGEPVWRRASFVLSLSLFLSFFVPFSLRSDSFVHSIPFLSLSSFTDIFHHSGPSSFFARAFLTHVCECRSFNVSRNLLFHSALLSRAISRHPRVYICACRRDREPEISVAFESHSRVLETLKI